MFDNLSRKVRSIIVPGQSLCAQEIERRLSDHETLVTGLDHDFATENKVERVGLNASAIQYRIVKTVMLLLMVVVIHLNDLVVVVLLLHYLVIIVMTTHDQLRLRRLNQLYLIDIDLLHFRSSVAFQI